MSDDLDRKIKRALDAIPSDPDVSARLVAQLAKKRRPLRRDWLIGGAVAASVAGFAAALLQGPVVGSQDAALFFLAGAL